MVPLVIAVILFLSLMYVCGRRTAKYAAQRGRSEAFWFVLGSVLYPLPYIVLAVLPPSHKEKVK
jgi:threonine/homoserine/homoserine lactone efflux protein